MVDRMERQAAVDNGHKSKLDYKLNHSCSYCAADHPKDGIHPSGGKRAVGDVFDEDIYIWKYP
jgi:hypothetical protein